MAKVRFLPSESRRRGMAAVGFDMVYGGDGVTTEPVTAPVIARVVETRDGERIGSITFEVAPVRLVIDRDGTLAQLVTQRSADAVPYALVLDAGASGYRGDVVVEGAALPYRSWLALAPEDAGAGGAVIVIVESTAADWQLGAAMLATLRVFCRDADARAPSTSGEALLKSSGS